MNLFIDLIDKGAQKNNNEPSSIRGFISVVASGCAMAISLNKDIISFLQQFAGPFPLVVNFLPLVFLILVILLLINVYMSKSLKDNILIYDYSNLIRQLAKIILLVAIVAMGNACYSLYRIMKPLDQPVVLLVKGVDGSPIPSLAIRILNEAGNDISSGLIETSTEKGEALLYSKSDINEACYILTEVKSKTYQIQLKSAQRMDYSAYNKPTYLIILK